ncbi:hypothetical protein [Umezawaea sp. Da 62-37]|uniref:hypothetical protein n=1 Tax=Umezawaea sp. Da 62-37 TaxID=3075927 RepID=UPI0028F74748|nr:hypothetical protein [Umezawaea sp. Da 62-37]WNV83920.1 hypothetical protein RM788_38015 [Umezawaea sp. Da 62-37]
MSLLTPLPEPNDENLERAVADVVKYVAAQAPSAAPIAPPTTTKRVQDLRAEVDEANALLELQAEDAPLLVDTDRVRRSRKRAAEAARLHTLAQDPAARAWQAARVRLVFTVVALAALVGALGWSTTGVHHTLTRSMTERDAAWWGAWAVEPVISAVLLVVVGARAFLATRDRLLRHRHLTVVEYGALVVTLTLNVWPYLPWVSVPWVRFDPMQLLAHAIGPLVAVGAVMVLPVIWSAFADLDHGVPIGPTAVLTSPEYKENGPDPAVPRRRTTDDRVGLLVNRARRMIAAGRLPADPSANRLREALGCGTDMARKVRDAEPVNGVETVQGACFVSCSAFSSS